jgi:hypothetical protein
MCDCNSNYMTHRAPRFSRILIHRMCRGAVVMIDEIRIGTLETGELFTPAVNT